MANITFRNVLEESSKFTCINKKSLIGAAYEFATFSDEDIYHSIMSQKVVLFLNGKYIPIDDWYYTKLKDYDEVIITPELGKDNLGGFLKIVVGAILVAGALTIGGPVASWGLWTKIAFSAGTSLVFGGLSDLLFKPDLPTLSGAGGDKSTQTYNWSGIKTMANPDSPIPVIYGTHNVGGNLISLFTEASGDDSYLNMLIALGEGEIEGICQEFDHTSICTTSDPTSEFYKSPAIKIDDQPLRIYKDVEWWYRKGTNLPDDTKDEYNPDYQNKIPHFDGAKSQFDDDREVPASPSYIEYITTKPVDMVTLQFYIPSLFDATGTDFAEETIRFKILYSTNGVDFYNTDNIMTHTYVPSVTGDRPAYCTCSSYINSKFRYTPVPTYKIKVIKYLSGWQSKYWNAFIDVYDSDGNIIESNVYVNGGIVVVGEYVVNLDENIKVGDEFTISSTLSTVHVDEIDIHGKTKTGLFRSVGLDFTASGLPGRGVYYLRIQRTDG